MSRILRTIAAVLLLGLVTWIASDAIQAGRATRTAQANAVRYYELEQEAALTFSQQAELISNAQQVCAYLDKQPSLPRLFDDMVASGLGSDSSVTTIEAAITAYCPQFSDLLQD